MSTAKASHRDYAGWSMSQIVFELERLQVTGPTREELLLEHPGRTSRWCFVEALVRHRNRQEVI